MSVDISLFLSFPAAWRSEHLATVRVDDYTHVLPGASAARHAGELLDHYLGMEKFTCCDLCAGLEVEVNGQSWTEHGCDHIGLITHWLVGLENVLQGGEVCETATWVGDQSYLVFKRNGHRLTLYDEHVYSRHRQSGEEGFAWLPVTVDLQDFAARLVEVGEVYARLVDNLAQEIASRGFTRQELLGRLEGVGDRPAAGAEDVELKLAILMRELPDVAGLRERLEMLKTSSNKRFAPREGGLT
jgi:hypothetical protein